MNRQLHWTVSADGATHAFLIEPTVPPEYWRRGIERALVEQAVAVAREYDLEWVHVNFKPPLREFCRAGFAQPTRGSSACAELAFSLSYPP